MVSPERVDKAIEQIRKRAANHDYFFSKLSSPDWIGPLEERGLFQSPPEIEREGDLIRFPFWPESQYLARMAAVAPEIVFETFERIPETDNVRVHEDFVDAAVNMPPDLAERLALKEADWIKRQCFIHFLLPEKYGELIGHLASGGRVYTALKLARSVFGVRRTSPSAREVSARFESWNYEKILKDQVPVLLEADAYETIKLLFDLLDDAMRALREGTEEEHDYSWIWRSAIEDHEQNGYAGELRDVLVTAIRDGAVFAVKNGFLTIESLVDLLSEKVGYIYKRIALHIVNNFADQRIDLARHWLLELSLFDRIETHHEYVLLLQTVFPNLCAEDQDQILCWINNGPEHNLLDEDEEVRSTQLRYWQRRFLYFLKGHLTEEWAARYQSMVEELGEPAHPDFLSYSTSWSGPTSPKNSEELRAMEPGQLAAYLKAWVPTKDSCSPSREGLGRILASTIATNIEQILADLPEFLGVDATYAKSIIYGIRQAVKEGSEVDCDSVLTYSEWIVNQDIEIPGRGGVWSDEDPSWGWARKAVAELLGVLFEKDVLRPEHREQAWSLLERLTKDSDPTPEQDNESAADPANLSINTTRGEAFHSLFKYALWVYRATREEREAIGELQSTFRPMPEVAEILERHLSPDVEKTAAIRSVYGQWFPWLVLLDREWASAHRSTIFPPGNSSNEKLLRNAAWTTYVTFCPVYDDCFEVLYEEYVAAIDRIGGDSGKISTSLRDADEHLGDHLMVLLGRGKLVLEEGGGLLGRFLDKADDDLVGRTLASVGRSLQNEVQDIPEEVLVRFRQFWEEISKSLYRSPQNHLKALRAFGWWFTSKRFPEDWSFQHLGAVLQLANGIEFEHEVLEIVAELAASDPLRAVSIAREIVRVDEHRWNVLGGREQLFVILRAAMDDEHSSEEAKMLVHELGARGHIEFRDLLSPG
jgi:hypothetical protein